MEKMTKLPVKTERKDIAPERGWSPFEGLRSEIDRLFEDFHPALWRFPLSRPTFDTRSMWSRDAMPVAPAMDLAEKEKEYEITAELPGMEEKDIEIKLANGTLTIKGEKTEQREEKEKDYYLSERRYGSFQRSVRLPEGVDTDKIEASYAKGILTVRLPKSAVARQSERKISIKAA